jgi:uncharacterized membrane protein YfcA
MMAIYAFLLIGLISGGLAGLLGLGGGVIVVPALAAAFSYYHIIPPDELMQMAVGTSLSTIILTFLVSLYTHAKHGSVRWDFVKRLLPFILIGVISGAMLAHLLPSHFLRIFFCVFLIVIAIRMFLPESKQGVKIAPSSFWFIAVAMIVGILSSFLGVGGGLILIPFLVSCQLPMRQAMGTSVACGLGIGVVATASFMLFGRTAVDLPWSTGYIYWPAFFGVATASLVSVPLGTALAYRLPTDILKRILAVFLLLVAVKMLVF